MDTTVLEQIEVEKVASTREFDSQYRHLALVEQLLAGCSVRVYENQEDKDGHIVAFKDLIESSELMNDQKLLFSLPRSAKGVPTEVLNEERKKHTVQSNQFFVFKDPTMRSKFAFVLSLPQLKEDEHTKERFLERKEVRFELKEKVIYEIPSPDPKEAPRTEVMLYPLKKEDLPFFDSLKVMDKYKDYLSLGQIKKEDTNDGKLAAFIDVAYKRPLILTSNIINTQVQERIVA